MYIHSMLCVSLSEYEAALAAQASALRAHYESQLTLQAEKYEKQLSEIRAVSKDALDDMQALESLVTASRLDFHGHLTYFHCCYG